MAAASVTFRKDTLLTQAFWSSGSHTFPHHFPWYVLSLRVGASLWDVSVGLDSTMSVVLYILIRHGPIYYIKKLL